MYNDILYPTDGSEGAAAALEHVRSLATNYDATVHVLCVLDTFAGLGIAGDPQKESSPGMTGNPKGEKAGMAGRRDGDLQEQATERASEIAERAAEQLEGVETKTAVGRGTPHTVILDYVDENGIDCIVMGTHGRTGLERYLLGSVTEKVVRLSDVPVVTVRDTE